MGSLFPEFDAAPARYPRSPGHKRQATSKAAADSMAHIAGTLRERVLTVIKRSACTPDEAAAALGITVLAARPRVSELLKLSLIVDTGERRVNESGKRAIVWAAK